MAKINLLLLDDHTLFRVMLGRLLETEPDFRVVSHCSAIAESLEHLSKHDIDLVLLDYDLGGRQTGLQFIEQARTAGYLGRIFIVTAGMSDAEYLAALGQGICGIFLKHGSPDVLIEAIRKVISGQTWMDERCISALVQAVAAQNSERRQSGLTERELQVLKGVFAGSSNKQIGVCLNISEASVKSALQQLFVKTGVRTRSQLVRVALEEYGSVLGL